MSAGSPPLTACSSSAAGRCTRSACASRSPWPRSTTDMRVVRTIAPAATTSAASEAWGAPHAGMPSRRRRATGRSGSWQRGASLSAAGGKVRRRSDRCADDEAQECRQSPWPSRRWSQRRRTAPMRVPPPVPCGPGRAASSRATPARASSQGMCRLEPGLRLSAKIDVARRSFRRSTRVRACRRPSTSRRAPRAPRCCPRRRGRRIRSSPRP